MTPEEKTFKEIWNTSCGEDARKAAPKFIDRVLDFVNKPEWLFLIWWHVFDSLDIFDSIIHCSCYCLIV